MDELRLRLRLREVRNSTIREMILPRRMQEEKLRENLKLETSKSKYDAGYIVFLYDALLA